QLRRRVGDGTFQGERVHDGRFFSWKEEDLLECYGSGRMLAVSRPPRYAEPGDPPEMIYQDRPDYHTQFSMLDEKKQKALKLLTHLLNRYREQPKPLPFIDSVLRPHLIAWAAEIQQQAISASTFYRRMREYWRAGNDERAWIKQGKRKAKPRIYPPELFDAIETVLRKAWLNKTRPSLLTVHEDFVLPAIAKLNAVLPRDKQLPMPAYHYTRTVRRSISQYEVDQKRVGEAYVREKYRRGGGSDRRQFAVNDLAI